MKKSTIKLDELTIGSKIFAVHKSYAFQKKPGGIVLPGRVIAFKNVRGFIEIIFRLRGSKTDCTLAYYMVFIDIKEAIDAIR